MADLTASPDIIIVDPELASTGPAKVTYSKIHYQELWVRTSFSGWARANTNALTGREGDAPLSGGEYTITLRPGDWYEAGVFEAYHGPTDTDPVRVADLKVYCLLKKPSERPLISDIAAGVGGTFYTARVTTAQPTEIVEIGVSRRAPAFDSNSLPRLPERLSPTTPSSFTGDHRSLFTPLFAGQHHFFVVIVADALGNWESRVREFDTLRRTVTIDFPQVIIHNDGDAMAHGLAEIWFGIKEAGQQALTREFHRSTSDVDDWSKQGRPYNLFSLEDGAPFHHVIGPKSVDKGMDWVSIHIHGTEYDGPLEADEKASGYQALTMPHGPVVEKVDDRELWARCGTGGVNDFNFSTKIVYSVTYAP